MGMFDEILFNEQRFQTKDFDNVMCEYDLTRDGLYLRRMEYKTKKRPKTFKGSSKHSWIDSLPLVDSRFIGLQLVPLHGKVVNMYGPPILPHHSDRNFNSDGIVTVTNSGSIVDYYVLFLRNKPVHISLAPFIWVSSMSFFSYKDEDTTSLWPSRSNRTWREISDLHSEIDSTSSSSSAS